MSETTDTTGGAPDDAATAPEPTPVNATARDPLSGATQTDAPGGNDVPKPSRMRRLFRIVGHRAWTVVRGLFRGLAGAWQHPTSPSRRLGQLIEIFRDIATPDLLRTVFAGLVRVGHFSLLLCVGAALVLAVIAWIGGDEVTAVVMNLPAHPMLCWLGFALLLFVAQFTAVAFLRAGGESIDATPSRLGSPALLNSLALLSEMAGAILFVAFTITAIRIAACPPFLVGLLGLALLDGFACVCLRPELAATRIEPGTRAGMEALGFLSFLLKSTVRVTPVAYGFGLAASATALLLAIVWPSMRSHVLPVAHISLQLAFLPILTYISFLGGHLLLDLFGAILGNRPEKGPVEH